METKPYSPEWVEGFITEACDMGLSKEQAQNLVKQASMMELSKDPAFKAGYDAEMQKQAGAGAQLEQALAKKAPTLLGTMWNHPAATALAGLGLGYGGYQAVRPHWNMNPEQQELYNQIQWGNPEQWQDIAQNFAHNHEARRGNEANMYRQNAMNTMRNSGMGMMGGMGGMGYPSYMNSMMY